ncbi:MAG: dihydrolipoyl dehydrogenase [Aigarchaeota archaeon]|nr:dihydrolipoyl dehydrogenase [Aigarchaeota archaeon]
MSGPSSCDVVVIGAGIGGYVAAIRASQLGMEVEIIEGGKVGGTCVNSGCIPTVALLTSAHLLEKIKRSEEYGINVKDISVNFERMMTRKEAIVNRLSDGVRYLLGKNEVRLIEGWGTIKSRDRVDVKAIDGTDEQIQAKNIVIATGSKPEEMPNVQIDGDCIITTDEALRLDTPPLSIAIIGGGIMGVEFAQIFRSLGADVTILEKMPLILPSMDGDIGNAFQRILRKGGIKIFTSVFSESAEIERGLVRLSAVSKGSKVHFETEKVLVTVGRKPFTEGLDLERVGVQLRDGYVAVDEHMRTSIPNIYAVGDVTGGLFAHAAFAEGIVAAESIAGMGTGIDHGTNPACVYTSPEIASVGLSEQEAAELGYSISVGRFPYSANGRALALGERDGFVKIVADKGTDEILGVHILGPNASNLISEAVVAMRLECTSEELSRAMHPHPTLSEAIMEAASDVSGRAIHI